MNHEVGREVKLLSTNVPMWIFGDQNVLFMNLKMLHFMFLFFIILFMHLLFCDYYLHQNHSTFCSCIVTVLYHIKFCKVKTY